MRTSSKFSLTEEAFLLNSLHEIVKIWASGSGKASFSLDVCDGKANLSLGFQLGHPCDQHYDPSAQTPNGVRTIVPVQLPTRLVSSQKCLLRQTNRLTNRWTLSHIELLSQLKRKPLLNLFLHTLLLLLGCSWSGSGDRELQTGWTGWS